MEPRLSWGLSGLTVACLVGLSLGVWACVTPPPQSPENACEIFDENLSWYRAARESEDRWGVPPSLQLAVIHQESSFQARARPPRSRLLWVLPGPRPSSAFGYGQVVDSTWDRYRRLAGRPSARRDDFADVADFIGWYASQIGARSGPTPSDPRSFYLAYHEGPAGFLRESHASKPWLVRVADRVASRSRRYQAQLSGCREELDARLASPWWWPL